MNNQFDIAPYKVLNETMNSISIWGCIPMFADEFTVNYTVQKVTPTPTSGAAPMPPVAAGSTGVNGQATIKRADLSSLSEVAIATEVAKQIGVKLIATAEVK